MPSWWIPCGEQSLAWFGRLGSLIGVCGPVLISQATTSETPNQRHYPLQFPPRTRPYRSNASLQFIKNSIIGGGLCTSCARNAEGAPVAWVVEYEDGRWAGLTGLGSRRASHVPAVNSSREDFSLGRETRW